MTTTENTTKTASVTPERNAQPLTLGKVKSNAFGKDVYLLGIDKSGDKVWLEAARWDFGWYWGFGYIERYTSQNPKLARDITSHSHWDSEIVGQHDYYDTDKQCFRKSSEYIHHLNDNPKFKATTLSDRESWELADLMKSFYVLKDAAECIGRGSAHVSSTSESANYKDEELAKRINEQMLPRIFARVYEILTPTEETADLVAV